MEKYLTHQITDRIIDKDTGEILDVHKEKRFVCKDKSESFLITYVKGLSLIYGIKNGASIRLLFKILELSKFNTSEVQISAPKKKQILEELDISQSAYTKAMKDLSNSGILSGERGLYTINPEVFWCGDSSTRKSFLDGSVKCEISFKPIENPEF